MSTEFYYEYIRCSYHNWWCEFQDDIYESVIINVPDNVLSYLASDVMVLPKNSSSSIHSTKERNATWTSSDDELEEPDFHEFDEKLKEAIQSLGGKVFIKLNWSAPKDASWITSTRSLCCSDPADIYLLLKSSTCISNDVTVLKGVSDTIGGLPCFLILKKWAEVHPGTEYRCFVIGKNLMGISQRDTTSYFKYIGDNKESILEIIVKYFLHHVKPKFPLETYTFDIIFALGMKIVLIDFGILNEDSNCLLFTWKELKKKVSLQLPEEASRTLERDHLASGEMQNVNRKSLGCVPEFRFIDEFTNVPQNQCKHYGIPEDVMHFCSGEKNVADYIQEEILNNRL